MLADFFLLAVSFFAALYAGGFKTGFQFRLIDFLFLIILSSAWVFSSKVTRLYDEFRSRDFSFELINLIKNLLVQFLSAIVFVFIAKEIYSPRLFVLVYEVFALILLGFEKYLFRVIFEKFRKSGRNLRSVLIIGAGEVGQRFYDSIYKNPHFGYHVLGFLDDDEKDLIQGKYLGPIYKLEGLLEKRQVDDVIVALPNYAEERLQQVIATCENYTTRVRIIPDYFKFFSQKYSISMFGKFPIISVREDRLNEIHWRMIKRVFDSVLTVLLFLFVFSWLWPLIIIAIRSTSKGPAFFKQERWGRNGKRFIALKFRSMSAGSKDINAAGEYQQATKNDPRITSIGKILRKTNLDELPQFINVLKGEMSLVGPRPHPTPLNLESKENIKRYMLRHLVKPGITGWAQVNGFRGETKDPHLMEKRVEYDLWYIEHWSFWLDLQILFLTVWKMVKGDPKAY
ncbi:MAG: undecaprenyl-phosphate glucose phosphotransferase [Bacteroidota bacterium]|nr:undecaprenyl-phosphate glucose phosphotransferase [Bacteroidota bacterium]